jgi:hypothetical protein
VAATLIPKPRALEPSPGRPVYQLRCPRCKADFVGREGQNRCPGCRRYMRVVARYWKQLTTDNYDLRAARLRGWA